MGKFFNDLYFNQDNNIKEYQKKQQLLKPILPEQYNGKGGQIISETDWIVGVHASATGIRNTKYNRVLPETYPFNESLSINIDQKFLPFIQVELLIKPTDPATVVGILPYSIEGYDHDYFEVTGNGNLIYKGNPHDTYYEYSADDLINGDFQESYTKKVYRAVIYYTDGGDEYKLDGRLIQTIVRENGSMVGGYQEYDEWEAYIDPGYVDSLSYSKYHDITNTEVDFTARRKEVRYVVNPSPPPDYFQQIAYYDNGGNGFRVTKSFSAVDKECHRLKMTSKYKKIDGEWVLQGTGDYTVDTESGHIITERSFQFVGYWLFYGYDTKYLFGIRDVSPVVIEGIYHKKELINLPQGSDRIWTSMSFKRHPDNHPEVISSDAFAIAYKQSSINKLYRTTDAEKTKFEFNVQGNFILSSFSTEKTSQQVPVYNDTYTKSGSGPTDTYSVSESHSLKNIDYYTPTFAPVEYKIRLSLINPYEFSNRENYEL